MSAPSLTVFGDTSCAWLHGGCGTPEYVAYISTKSRCRNPNNPQWQYYGGRGVEFRFSSFTAFRDHLGLRPAGKILSLIRPDGHFELGNVHWTTRCESAKNRKVYRKATYHRKARVTTCGHPKHYAKNLCRACYEATPKVRTRKAKYAAARYIRTPRKITARVNSCGHFDRPHYAFGFCAACYRVSPEGRSVRLRYAISPKGKQTAARNAAEPANRARQNAYSAARYIPRPRPTPVNTCGHLDRPHKSGGRCQSCYDIFRHPRKSVPPLLAV